MLTQDELKEFSHSVLPDELDYKLPLILNVLDLNSTYTFDQLKYLSDYSLQYILNCEMKLKQGA